MSDSRFAGENPDESGPRLASALREAGYSQFTFTLVPDETAAIQEAILAMCHKCTAIFTTGGTGFAPKDLTPEATQPLIERPAPNLSELMRLAGHRDTPFAHLSRGVAGLRGGTLIVNLPGSPAGVVSGIKALAPLLPHLFETLADSQPGHPRC